MSAIGVSVRESVGVRVSVGAGIAVGDGVSVGNGVSVGTAVLVGLSVDVACGKASVGEQAQNKRKHKLIWVILNLIIPSTGILRTIGLFSNP